MSQVRRHPQRQSAARPRPRRRARVEEPTACAGSGTACGGGALEIRVDYLYPNRILCCSTTTPADDAGCWSASLWAAGEPHNNALGMQEEHFNISGSNGRAVCVRCESCTTGARPSRVRCQGHPVGHKVHVTGPWTSAGRNSRRVASQPEPVLATDEEQKGMVASKRCRGA